MKLSSIVCASLVALALTAQAVSAIETASERREHQYKIGTAAGTTEADCTKNKGIVSKDRDGAKSCRFVLGGNTDTGDSGKTATPAPATTPSPK